MQSQQETIDTLDGQTEKINVDGFIEADEDFKETVRGGSGFARLTDAELISSRDVPQAYKDEISSLADDYLKFNGEIRDVDGEVTVLVPAVDGGKTLTQAFDWADADDISGLAGERVPVRRISEGVYRIKRFRRYRSPWLVEQMMNFDLIWYEGGDWQCDWKVSFSTIVLAIGLIAISALTPYFLFTAFGYWTVLPTLVTAPIVWSKLL